MNISDHFVIREEGNKVALNLGKISPVSMETVKRGIGQFARPTHMQSSRL